jgi:parvulin-like peptidyl-prolyl isomerase
MRRPCILFALGAALALAGCRKPALLILPPLAVVNGEPIAQQDLLAARRAQALPLSLSAQAALSPAADGALDDAALLDQLIDECLMLQRARELKLEPPEGLISQEEQEARGGMEPAAWSALLADQGLSDRDFTAQLERRWLLQAVAQSEVYDKVPVSDRELRDYYWEHLGEFKRKERRRLLMISCTSLSEAQKAQQELGLGEPFGAVGKLYGKGPEAAQGGDLGWVTASDLPTGLAKAAFGLKVGRISGIVRSAYGWHLILAEEARPPVNVSFEEAAAGIRQRLKQSKAQEPWQAWLFQLRKAARIQRGPGAKKG